MTNRIKRPKAKARLRRATQEVRQIMEDLAAGRIDPFIGYGKVRNYYNMLGIHDTLVEFFKAVDKDQFGTFTADDAFRKAVREMAADWLERY
ncbi:MAG: hypothetical protein WBQ04_06435 [Candidatus Acidiferrales bacterium]